jgi:hypothetical protein
MAAPALRSPLAVLSSALAVPQGYARLTSEGVPDAADAHSPRPLARAGSSTAALPLSRWSSGTGTGLGGAAPLGPGQGSASASDLPDYFSSPHALTVPMARSLSSRLDVVLGGALPLPVGAGSGSGAGAGVGSGSGLGLGEDGRGRGSSSSSSEGTASGGAVGTSSALGLGVGVGVGVDPDADPEASSVPPIPPSRRSIFSPHLLTWLRLGAEKEDGRMVERRAVVLRALQAPTAHPPSLAPRPPPPRPRSSSFCATTAREDAIRSAYRGAIDAKKHQLAAAKTRASQAAKISNLAGLVLFLFLLVLGYTSYRLVACPRNILHWQCIDKPFQAHWDDVMQMVAIGGVLYASGPTVVPSLILPSLVVFGVSMLTFGALGEAPILLVALNSAATWRPPALFVYLAAILLVGVFIGYSFWAAASLYDVAVSGAIVAGIIALYSSAAAVAFAAGLENVSFHPHHFMIAWHLCLLFRNRSDAPTVLIRWLLMGIFVQGLAAYSAASLLSDGAPCAN